MAGVIITAPKPHAKASEERPATASRLQPRFGGVQGSGLHFGGALGLRALWGLLVGWG